MQLYQKRLSKLKNKTIFGTGCGGGFDFMHCATLYPYFKELNCEIIIGSYSFGNVSNYQDAEVIWSKTNSDTTINVKKVYANTKYIFLKFHSVNILILNIQITHLILFMHIMQDHLQ